MKRKVSLIEEGALEAYIAQIKTVELKRWTRWPKTKIGPHQIVVGKARPFTKQICVLIQKTEIKIRDLKKRHANFISMWDKEKKAEKNQGKDKYDARDDFYDREITPLEDKLLQLNSCLILQLRYDFKALSNKKQIGVGQGGQAFYFNLPGENPIHPRHGNLLIEDPIHPGYSNVLEDSTAKKLSDEEEIDLNENDSTDED